MTGRLSRLAASAGLAYPLLAVALALASAAGLLMAVGADPVEALRNMYGAALGSGFALSTTGVKALPRLLSALGIALALRAGLWNIGAEGQLYIGAAASTAVALFGPQLPFPLAALAALLAGCVAGALWGFLPGVLRATRGVSEVITSLMLVYVGIQVVGYLVSGPWSVPGATFPASEPVPQAARLPLLVPGTLLNAGVVVALLAAVVAWVVDRRTTLGLRLRAVGGNATAAGTFGIRVPLMVIVALCLSGAFAGLAGAVEVLGARGRLIQGFSPGYGFEAIAVALLGRLKPAGIAAAALLFGALDAGGAGLQAAGSGVPAAIVQLTGALSVLYLLAALGIRERSIQRRRARAALKEIEEPADRSPEPAAKGAT